MTFVPSPVYTLGRREVDSLSPAQILELKIPLKSRHGIFRPDVVQTKRGGQTTFHGPGQLVIYPIIDLLPAKLRPRDYVRLLETVTLRVLARNHIQGCTTDDPGVWIVDTAKPAQDGPASSFVAGVESAQKIAAVGVHLRRSITSYGVGLNISTDLRFFDRIVPCGLEGKGVTTMERQLGHGYAINAGGEDFIRRIASTWAHDFALGVWGPHAAVETVALPPLGPRGLESY